MENKDIIDGIAKIRLIFKSLGLDSPSAILLKSHREGEKFLCQVHQENILNSFVGDTRLGKPIEMADGSMVMECSIMGIAIRWPANRIATRDGSWSLG